MVKKRITIKRKILLGYTSFILMSAAAVFVLYQGITQIVSLEAASSAPNTKLKRINKLLGAIYESENNSRSYFLFRKQEDLYLYIKSSEQIEYEVNSFRQYCKGNKAQEIYLMEINHLLIEKRSIIQQLIDFNRSSNQDSLIQKAINDLYTTTYKHFDKPVVIARTTTIKSDSIYKAPKKVGFFERLKNVFVHTKESNKESLTKVNVVRTEQLDTIKPFSPKPEKVENSVRTTFFKLKDKENEIKQLANEKEMNFLSNDRRILERIRSLVAQIETEELQYTNSALSETQQIIKKSIYIITILSLLALLLMAIFMIIISRDIARSNAYQKALKEARLQAESLLKLKEQFVANISHEIRTPLSAITGFSEQLQKTKVKEEKDAYALHIHHAAEHLHQLVNQVLDLSKVQAGMLQLESIPFDIIALGNEVHTLFLQQGQAKNIDLQLDNQITDESILIGDPFRIRQILINLLGNALKFTKQGTVTLKLQSEFVKKNVVAIKITVSDTGIGIAEDKLSSIFEEFTQANQSTTRQYGGTGLGLAIARKLTEAMNGNLHVTSILNEGSQFILSLQLPLAENQLLPKEQPLLSSSSFKDILLLFVEDDDIIRLLISKIMNNNGISCMLAPNAEEALKLVALHHFDIIFSDIQMPGMNGFELVNKIREIYHSVPVIALTARNEKIETYLENGFTDVLTKPYKENEILLKIAYYIPQTLLTKEQNQLSSETKSTSTVQLFNTTLLSNFVRQDKSALIEILEIFIENTRLDIAFMQKALKDNDSMSISNKSHKMLSMYRQLEIESLVETLELLEQNLLLELPYSDIELLINHLCNQSLPILDLIEANVVELKHGN